MEDPKIAIVIPLYNDWENLPPLLDRIDQSLSGQQSTVSIFIVDDCSTSGAGTFLDNCRQKDFSHISRIFKIRLSRNMGHQGAIVVGICHVIKKAIADCIVIMDADGEDRPEDIEKLLEKMEKTGRRSLIFARRRKRKEGAWFKTMYSLFKFLHYFLTGHPMDFGNFSVIPAAMAESLISFHEMWNHYPATAVKSKLPLEKVSCDRGRRIDGKSKMSVTALLLHGLGSIAVFAPEVGTRMLLVFTGSTLLFIAGIFCIFGIRFFTELAIPGWATYTTGILGLLIFQSLSLSLLFIFFILNSRNPFQFVPKQNYQLFIDDVHKAWDQHETL